MTVGKIKAGEKFHTVSRQNIHRQDKSKNYLRQKKLTKEIKQPLRHNAEQESDFMHFSMEHSYMFGTVLLARDYFPFTIWIFSVCTPPPPQVPYAPPNYRARVIT